MADTPDVREDLVNSSLIAQILKEKFEGIYRLISYKANIATEKGDNFVGDLIDCEVKAIDDSNNEEQTFHWMCKVMKKGKAAELMSKLNVFNREEAFYTTYLEDLSKYVRPNILRTVPLIYSLNEPEKQILVFEHLGYSGYRDPKHKKEGLDQEHVRAVLKWMAELHGAGFLLFKKYPGGYESWKKNNNIISDPLSSEMFENITEEYMTSFCDSLAHLKNGSDNDAMVDAFIPLFKNFFEDLPKGVTLVEKANKVLYHPRSHFKTLVHGDPWFNNMLFKYENGDKLIDVILLDMQVVYSGNIGSDLAYFFLSSVAYDNLSENLNAYIEYYRDSLIQFLNNIEPGVEVPLSAEDIKTDFLKSLIVGCFFAIGVFPMVLVDKEEMPPIDLHDYDWSKPEEVKRYSDDTKANTKKLFQSNSRLNSRLTGVIRFLMESNFSKYCKFN